MDPENEEMTSENEEEVREGKPEAESESESESEEEEYEEDDGSGGSSTTSDKNQPVSPPASHDVPSAVPQGQPHGGVPGGAPQPAPAGAPQPAPAGAPQPVPAGAPQPVPAGAPQPQNLTPEQTVDRLFNLNQPQNAQQGQQPQGIHESTLFAGPKKTKRNKAAGAFDVINKGAGYLADAAGMVSGAEKILMNKNNANHKNGAGYWNIGLAGLKTTSSLYSMSRNAHHARKAYGKNKIEHRRSTIAAISADSKSIAGLMGMGASGSAMGNDKDKAKNFGIAGSVFGMAGALGDMIGGGIASEDYRKIAKKYDPQNLTQSMQQDNSVKDAAGMASLHARHKHRLNAAASGFSSFSFLNSLAGLGGALSSRTGAGIFGLFGNLLSLGGKAIADTTEGCLMHNNKVSRRQYVQDYLNSEAQKIMAVAGAGDPQHNIQGIAIKKEDAKRIALKKLGMFTGNTVTGAPFNIDDKQADQVYNALAMHRADSLANSRSNDKAQMLADLGLSANASREEIAAMLGYEK